MSTIRTLTMIAALTAGAAACHDRTADKVSADPVEKAAKPTGSDAPAGSGSAMAAAPEGAGLPASSAKPRSVGTMTDADAERFYAFIEQMVAIAVANQDDCAKLAAGIAAFADANQALIKDASDMQQQHKEFPPAIKEKMARKFKDELSPAMTRKCSNDKAVMAAFQKIKRR